jgi:methanogenic corrinoid protein MtbC1
MSKTPEETEYSIAAVSKLTGASCHALRVWERRYGFPIPYRSASGHRRYTREQVRALRTITQLAQLGRPISELITEYRAGGLPTAEPTAPSAGPVGEAGATRLVDCLIAGDLEGGEAGYRKLTEGLGPVEIVGHVIGPAWIDAGERWFRREAAIHQERIVSEFLRRKIEVLIDAARLSNEHPTHTLLVGTVQGDRHIGGVLMLSLLMERTGWRVLNLGADLPVREYFAAVDHWHPDALALSFVLSRNIKKRFQELREFRALPVFVGGRSILNYQGLARRHGLIPLPGPVTSAVQQLQSEFERWIEAHAPRPAS